MNSFTKNFLLNSFVISLLLVLILAPNSYPQQSSVYVECNRIMDNYKKRVDKTNPILDKLYKEAWDKLATPGMNEVLDEIKEIRKETNELYKLVSKSQAGCYKDVAFNQQERNAIQNYNERLNYAAKKMKQYNAIGNLSPASKALFNDSIDKFINLNQKAFADLQSQLTRYDQSRSIKASQDKIPLSQKQSTYNENDLALLEEDYDNQEHDPSWLESRLNDSEGNDDLALLEEDYDNQEHDPSWLEVQLYQNELRRIHAAQYDKSNDSDEGFFDFLGDVLKFTAIGVAIWADVDAGTTHNTQNMANIIDSIENGTPIPPMIKVRQSSLNSDNSSNCGYAKQRSSVMNKLMQEAKTAPSVCGRSRAAVSMLEENLEINRRCGAPRAQLQSIKNSLQGARNSAITSCEKGTPK